MGDEENSTRAARGKTRSMGTCTCQSRLSHTNARCTKCAALLLRSTRNGTGKDKASEPLRAGVRGVGEGCRWAERAVHGVDGILQQPCAHGLVQAGIESNAEMLRCRGATRKVGGEGAAPCT